MDVFGKSRTKHVLARSSMRKARPAASSIVVRPGGVGADGLRVRAAPEPIEIRIAAWSPERQAQFARLRIRRRHRIAERNARNVGRIYRQDLNRILVEAYRFVRLWQLNRVEAAVEQALRRQSGAGIAPSSNLFLVLVRSALTTLDIKQASKWAGALTFANENKAAPRDLLKFLARKGGVEGCYRRLTALRRKRIANKPKVV